MNKRLNLMRTIEPKRTISSEQGHYHRSQHTRKLTLENFDAKSTYRLKNQEATNKHQFLEKTKASQKPY